MRLERDLGSKLVSKLVLEFESGSRLGTRQERELELEFDMKLVLVLQFEMGLE